MTYTSKNELVTFDAVTSRHLQKNQIGTAQRQHMMLGDGETTTAEERAMIDLVLQSSAHGQEPNSETHQQLVLQSQETDRVHLNLSTAVKADNLKELAAMKLLEQLRRRASDASSGTRQSK